MLKGFKDTFFTKRIPIIVIGLFTVLTLIAYIAQIGKIDIRVFYNKISTSSSSSPALQQRAKMDSSKVNISQKQTSGMESINLRANLTIVTAYFDIGDFGKGEPSNVWNDKTYLEFSRSFRYLMNPVVMYTDSRRFFDWMRNLRANSTSLTKLFLIDKRSSWAFEKKKAIKDIYSSWWYPKHWPNTVVPEYSCAQHAKYDVVARAANENYFQTDYFAWLDVGLFRAEGESNKSFVLQLPPDFNSSRIAVCEVNNPNMNTEMASIFRNNMVWVCGCIFVGKRDVILKYTEQYKRAVDYFLSKKLMNTDQQVLYATYSVSARRELKATIDLQLYKSNNSGYNVWFYLGYIMRKFI